MKHKNFLKTAFTLLLCGSISMANAADIYLSPTGSDTNDGSSVGTSVKTLSKAFTIAAVNDVIHVLGMINISEEPVGTGARATIDIAGVNPALVLVKDGVTYTTWNAVTGTLGIIPHTRSVTLVGNDKATCGFDGGNASCIIRQDQANLGANNGGIGVPGVTVIDYKNLTFRNGKSNDASGGGGVYFRGSTASIANFENCDFTGNVGNQGTSLKAGGALSIVTGVSSVKKCTFSANSASKGAVLYIQSGNVTMDSCVFENNDISATAATVGGAIYAYPTSATSNILNLDIKNSLFKNNKAENQGGALWVGETVANSVSTIKLTNCAFVDNATLNATGMGGAVFVNNVLAGATANLSFINTTFKGNQAGANTAGAIAVNGLLVNSQFNMINCTVSGNKVTGTTGAGGAGVRFLKGTIAGVRTIKNYILENNTAVDANQSSAADYADLGIENIVDPVTLVETPTFVAGTTLIIEKSIIGSCKIADFSTQFPLNNSNYAAVVNGSIASSYVAKLGVFNQEKNYFPLLTGSAAIGYGNATYLSSLTPPVTIDQIGRNRPALNCSAGAYEFATVSGLKNMVNNSIKVFKNANNQLVITNADATNGSITVCNMVGQVITSAPINGSVTTINKSFTSGVYLVMVNINGNISTKKVMLN